MLVAAGPFDSCSTVADHRFVAECTDASIEDSIVLAGFVVSCFAFTYFAIAIDSASAAAAECSSPC